MAQSIAVNSLVALAGRFLSLLISLAVTATLTRMLGVELFGVYSAILALGSLLLVATDLGLHLTLTRQLGAVSHPTAAVVSVLFSQVLWLRLAALIIVCVIGWGVASFIPPVAAHPAAWWIVVASLAAQSVSQLLMGVYQATSVVWRATLGDLVGRSVQFGVILAAPTILFSYLAPVTAMTAAFFLSTFTALVLHRLFLPLAIHLKPPRLHQWRTIIATSWPLAAMLVLNAVYFRIDMVILTLFRSTAEVGAYGLAYRIIESGLFIPAMFGGLLLPHFSRLRPNPAASAELLNEALRATALVAGLLTTVLAALAQPLVIFFSGHEFQASAPMLTVLSAALCAMFFGNIFGYALVAYERQRALMWLYLALAVGNLVANLALVPRFGPLAAAATTVATELAATTAAGVLVFRLVPYRLSPSFLVGLAAAVVATSATVWFLPNSWHVGLQAALAAAVFGCITFVLRLIHPREFRHLLSSP